MAVSDRTLRTIASLRTRKLSDQRIKIDGKHIYSFYCHSGQEVGARQTRRNLSAGLYGAGCIPSEWPNSFSARSPFDLGKTAHSFKTQQVANTLSSPCADRRNVES